MYLCVYKCFKGRTSDFVSERNFCLFFTSPLLPPYCPPIAPLWTYTGVSYISVYVHVCVRELTETSVAGIDSFLHLPTRIFWNKERRGHFLRDTQLKQRQGLNLSFA